MPVHSTLPRRQLAAVPLLVALVALGGCGSSRPKGTGPDPAGVVPASAPVYVGATVRPTGALESGARAAGRALAHQADPYLRLLSALQTPGSAALSFKRDLAPWLGANAGIFLSSPGASNTGSTGQQIDRLLTMLGQGLLGGSSRASAFPFAAGGPQGALVLDAADSSKARSFLSSQAARAGAHAASYRGVPYQSAAGGAAFGLVDRFAVIGSEAGLRGVIDTSVGGPPLARAPAYSRLVALAPSGVLAHLYAAAGALPTGGGPSTGVAAGLLQLLVGSSLVNVSLVPSSSSVALDAVTMPAAGAPAGSGGLLGGGGEGARALGELPGESFLAIGFGGMGSSLGGYARALSSLTSLGGGATPEGPEPGLSVKGLLGGLLTPLKLLAQNSPQARRDFQSWMGSGAVFVSGSGLIDLKGALVISSSKPALSRAAVGKLAVKLRGVGGSTQPASLPGTDAAATARLAGLPVVLDIADGRDAKGQTKFVIGLGESSVATALNPSSTLAGTASYAAASSALGEGIQPSLSIQVPTLLTLLEGAGLSEDPSIAPVIPLFRSLTTLSGGAKSLGAGARRARLVLGLRPGS